MQLKMQDMVLIGLNQGYLNAQQQLAQAHECYEQLTSQPLLVHTRTLFIEAITYSRQLAVRTMH